LHATTPPRAAGIEDTLDDVAAYLRRQPKKMQTLVESHYAAALARVLPAEAPQKKVSSAAARAALDLLGDLAEPARFIYGPAKLEWPEGVHPQLSDRELWLLGVGRRLLLFAAGDQPRVIWRGAASGVRAEQSWQLLTSSCRLTGGQWHLTAGIHPLAIRLPTGLIANYSTYFRPLLMMVGRPNAASDEPAIAAG